MKILIISPQFPYPPYSGSAIRLYNIIKHLSERHDITLLAMIKEGEYANIETMRKSCEQVYVVENKRHLDPEGFIKIRFNQIYHLIAERLPTNITDWSSDETQKMVGELTNKYHFDIIQFETIFLAQYCHSIFPKSINILCLYDIESVRQRRICQNFPFFKKKYREIECFKYSRYERHICPLFDACLTVSETDAHYLQKISPKARIVVNPNGVDTEYFLPCSNNHEDTKRLVFTGLMSYPPNHEGMLYFSNEIFPLIRGSEKQAHLYIVGMNPQKPILDLSSDPNITVTGMVEDVRPYIASASVCIVPLRSGSGTRLKILEAMAMGKAVISTSVGCEGIDVTHEKNIIIADEPSDFAQWCIELLRNPDMRRKLGQEGRKLVEAKYGWRSICASLEEFYISQLN